MPYLYRAADDDYVSTGTSFAEDLDSALFYLNNPGFGGSRLWRANVSRTAAVIDLRGYTTRQLARSLGVHDPGAIGVDEWLPRDPDVTSVLRDRGYLWAKVSESYPEGTTTWIWLGDAEHGDDDPVLRAMRVPRDT